MQCPICNNDENNEEFVVREMQQGLKEKFDYVECSKCGCLFIKNIPEDISKYYDINYGSHTEPNSIDYKIYDKTYPSFLNDNKIITLILGKFFSPFNHFLKDLIQNKLIQKNDSILDIGCGSGKFLKILKRTGFKDLSGVDLFIDEENMIEDVKIYQAALENFNPNRQYDVIFSNHAFEHMDNQLINLKCFENLIKADGVIFLRFPVKSKSIWDKYGVNWFQIDAPRHFFLHTVESFKILCNKTNLVIEDIVFDSNDDCLINCEKYVQSISTRDDEWNSFKLDKETTKKLVDEIHELNKKGEGDQAIFILKKV